MKPADYGYFRLFSNAFSRRYKGAAMIHTMKTASWTVEFRAIESASFRAAKIPAEIRNKPRKNIQKNTTGSQSGPWSSLLEKVLMPRSATPEKNAGHRQIGCGNNFD